MPPPVIMIATWMKGCVVTHTHCIRQCWLLLAKLFTYGNGVCSYVESHMGCLRLAMCVSTIRVVVTRPRSVSLFPVECVSLSCLCYGRIGSTGLTYRQHA